MSLYRKKPVTIEARQLTRNALDICRWVNSSGGEATINPRGVIIDTLEGRMQAYERDYVIKGVKGEFYPCKPDIFEATYEPVDGAT